MDLQREFAERYKKMSNAELLEVLQNPSYYQPAALAIAKQELDTRQLSEEEIREANQYLADKKIKKEKQDERTEALKNKMLDSGNTLYETINPVQSTLPTAEKIIRLISLVFIVMVIYQVVSNWYLFSLLLQGDLHERYAYTLYLFPVIAESGAVLLFWFRKKTGWIMLTGFCSYSLVDVLFGLYHSVSYLFNESGFTHFFPAPSPLAFIVSALFYAGTIFTMKRQDIKEIYRISIQDIQGSLLVGGIAGILTLFLQLFS